MEELVKQIKKMGHQLVKCPNNCEGITKDLSKGIIPRCLFLEYENRADSIGSIVVGINPGIATEKEMEFYVKNGNSYDSILSFWNPGWRYYSYLRDFLNCFGFRGPILWTELAKCQSSIKGELPPTQTFRTCVNKYLNDELKIVDKSWPLIAVGKETYKALAYLYPNRTVIGVPHPTSSWGSFHPLFQNPTREQFSDDVKIKVQEILKNSAVAKWLGKKE